MKYRGLRVALIVIAPALCLVIGVLVVFLPRTLEAEMRIWTSSDGNYTVVADFVDFRDGKVLLEKTTGAIISVPIDKISEEDVKAVEAEITNTKKAIESEDLEQIKSATEALSQASHKLTEVMYQQASAQQQAQQQGPGTQGEAQEQQPDDKAEEEVIDAEVVDEEEKK